MAECAAVGTPFVFSSGSALSTVNLVSMALTHSV
jgi:hypothetical protein